MKGKRVQFQKKSKKDGRGKVQRDQVPRILPQLSDHLAIGFTYRFVTTSSFAGSFNVTASNLLDCWFVAGTATTAYQLFDFVRVKRVIVRAMGAARPAVSGVSAASAPMSTVGVEYIGLSAGVFAGGRQKSDSALGYEEPAYVSLAPDPKSQCAQFQVSGGTSIFAVRAIDEAGLPLIGATIDVEVVLRNSGDVNPAAVGVARAGMTAGNLYFGGLDGQVLASTQARSVFIPRA